MSEETKTTIYQKIAAVQKKLKTVAKDATVGSGSFSYMGTTYDKGLSVIREHCLEHGVMIFPDQVEKGLSVAGKTKNGGDKMRFEGLYRVRFVSVDDGTELTMNIEGHGEDSNDKGPGKAATYATKTAMIKMFLLATGENDEERMEEEPLPDVITESQVADLESLAMEVKADIPRFLRHLGVSAFPQLYACNFAGAIADLEKKRCAS